MIAPAAEFDCPVLKESQSAMKSARDLSRSLKRMARLMRHCQSCQKQAMLALAAAEGTEFRSECPVLLEINAQIEAAILDLNREWGLLP